MPKARAVPILLAAICAGACRTPQWDTTSIVGDVVVEDRGEEHSPRYWLRFPEISLSRDATRTFVLRSCPRARAHFALLVRDEADAQRIGRAGPELDLTIAGGGGTILRFDGLFSERAGDMERERWVFGKITEGDPAYYPSGVGLLPIGPEQQYLFILRTEVSTGGALSEDLRVQPVLAIVDAVVD